MMPAPSPVFSSQPHAPRWLNEEARREWRRVVRELHRTGVLTMVDVATLEAYCVSYARWRHGERMLEGQPEVIESDKGNLYQNPWYGVARTAMRDMLRLAQELGMTPAARSRVVVEQQSKELSLADELMALAQMR